MAKPTYVLSNEHRTVLAAIHRSVKDAVTCDERIAVLRQACRGNARTPKGLRRARLVWTRLRRKQRIGSGVCVCCRAPTTHQHHVIPLLYGGNPIAPENRVWICHDCHICVHPWMQPDDYEQKNQAAYEQAVPCWSRNPRLI